MKFIFSIFFIGLASVVSAQLRFEVVKYPEFLTQEKRLFIATDFNNWDPSSEEYELKKDGKGVFSITLPDTFRYFEYKFTQGSWLSSEGGPNGYARPNRIYEKSSSDTSKTIKIAIETWETVPQYEFIVSGLPKNTPHDAHIFIAGNFNSWNPSDPNFRLKKQLDGSYRILVYSQLPKLEYKFTRGSWESVEGRSSGKARPNRIFTKNSSMRNKIADIEILSWEDLTGTFNYYSIYDILLLFAALQGLLFIIAIPGIQDYNRLANRWLLILMGFVSVLTFIRVMWTHREIAENYPKIQLLPDFILLIYAPLFYFYLQKLLFQSQKLAVKRALHFIPVLLQFFVYLPYFLMDARILKLKIVNQDTDLQIVFGGVGLIGLIANAYYWALSFKAIRVYKEQYQTRYSYEQSLHYLNTVLAIQAICLVLWLFTGILYLFGGFVFAQNSDIMEKSIDVIWLVFSTINYFLGYYAIHQPEVFKMPQPEELLKEEPTSVIEAISEKIRTKPTPSVSVAKEKVWDENLTVQKEKIEDYLKKSRAYSNPNLSLNELAAKLKMPPHTLSKIINDGFGVNFFDFINSYRIEEFKKLVHDPRYKNQTFLAIAFEVGFNSKTAFNRSFKKMTNQTPRDYILGVNEQVEEA
ncbi:MAG: helix-turn-helix domain-containing protein [Saprospiraceae bacterium]|nr:helix-turn-helix domain-containing protein [Saprospiraceae bacterium]